MNVNSQQNSATTKGSRINSDVERLINLTRRVIEARERITRHTSALGYFADEPPGATNQLANIAPIPSTLSSALSDLDYAAERLHAALSLFD